MADHDVRIFDADAARLLVAGLTGIHPDKIAEWTLYMVEHDLDGHIVTTGCCAHHTGLDLPVLFGPRLHELPPCSSDHP